MAAFIFSQIVGLCLFITLNFGILSYINYRKNQAAKSNDGRLEWLFLQNVRVGLYIFFITGIFYRLNTIQQQFNIDYSYLFLRALLISEDLTFLIS